MTAEQEVPPVAASSKGTGTLTINETTGELSGSVTATDLTAESTSAHIHTGFAGLNGEIVITLERGENNPNQWNVPAGSVLAADQRADLLAGKMYINIHTAAHAPGEIRGQITRTNLTVLRVDLDGILEVPTVDTAASAVAYITVETTGDRAITANIRTTGLDDATNAHIHSGFAGENGPVVIGFEQDAADPSLWELPAGSKLTQAELDTLLAGGNYLNVHAPASPSGLVRGQIAAENILLARSELNGAFEVPNPVTSAASAVAYLTLNKETGSLHANIRNSNLPDASAAHIHKGFAGLSGSPVITLSQDTDDTSLWASPADATLTQEEIRLVETGATYLNMHSDTNPAGELRGQIAPADIDVVQTELNGNQAVPPVDMAATAVGYTTINLDSGTVTANIRTSDLSALATAAHIHSSPAGSSGPVVITFDNDADTPELWATPANSHLTAEQLNAYQNSEFYFNVHTPTNPSGEIRGQIHP